LRKELTRVGNSFEFLLLLLVFLLGSLSGSIQPGDGLGDGLVERFLVGSFEFVLEVSVDRVSEVVRVRL